MELNHEYIRGLIDGEGCFTFCSVPNLKEGEWIKAQIPAFVLSMHVRDKELIKSVAETLSLRNRIYTYKRRLVKDNYNHGAMSTLIVRDLGRLKNIIVPFFYKKLVGYKGVQLEEWIERIENNVMVPKKYKVIPLLYKTGFYDKNNKFTGVGRPTN